MDLLNVTIRDFQIYLIVLLRVSGIFVLSPIFGAAAVPQQIKILACVFLTYVMLPLVASTNFIVPIDFLNYVIVLARELFVGLLIGFSALLVLNIIQFAGRMIDMGMGLQMASVVDPMSRDQASVVGQIFYFLATLLMLTTNTHYYIIAAMARSFEVVPLNGLALNGKLLQVILHLFMNIFSIGFQMAIPIAGILFIVTFSLGVISKAVPQLNVFQVGIPFQIIAGLILLLFSFNSLFPVFVHLLLSMKNDLFLVISAMVT